MIYYIIAIIILLLLGIGSILYEMRQIRSQINMINLYINTVNTFFDKFKHNADNSFEVGQILKYSDEIHQLLDRGFESPAYKLYSELRDNITFAIEDTVREINYISPSRILELQKDFSSVRNQLWNPFIWFYKGIEVISWIVLGYFVENGTLEYRGKFWNALNALFSLLASICTVIEFIRHW